MHKTTKNYFLVALIFILGGISTQAIAESFAVIGSSKNTVSEQSARQQVKKLYLKQKSKWSNGLRGKVFDRAENTPEHEKFRDKLLGMNKADLSNHWLRVKQKTGETPPRVITSTRTLIRLISKYDGSFGVVEEKYAKTLPNDVRILFTF